MGQPLSYVRLQVLPNLNVSADKVPRIIQMQPKEKEDMYCAFKLFSVLSSEALTPQSFHPPVGHGGLPY